MNQTYQLNESNVFLLFQFAIDNPLSIYIAVEKKSKKTTPV